MNYNCIQRNQSIFALYTTNAFKESKYYCVAKLVQKGKYYCNMSYIQVQEMIQIYYIFLLFEKLFYEHVKRFHVQGTKLYKLSFGKSKYTLLSTGQFNIHLLLATIYYL